MREEDLYPPVKGFLERQGYAVKGEVGPCDVVALRPGEPPVVVELKLTVSLTLILQGIDRLKTSDAVYLAIPRTRNGKSVLGRRRRAILNLCRRLGLGLLSVDIEGRHGMAAQAVEAVLDPLPYTPRKSKRRTSMLLKEFDHRVGDPNAGGARARPRVTAYRQDALRIADCIGPTGQAKPKDLRAATGVAKAGTILQRDVYGWFQRVDRGVYALSPKGEAALTTFADTIAQLKSNT